MALFRARSRVDRRVLVGMSGGVDSSVAAVLLKRAGYDVVGITLKTWPAEECGLAGGRACCNLDGVVRARALAGRLGIPYYVVDVSARFRREVIDPFCAAYLSGVTPNPCILCNERVKFAALLERADALGAARVATGHYARIVTGRKRDGPYLAEGADAAKDQSYFLFRLGGDVLSRCLFPLGGLTKDRVRRIAGRYALPASRAVSSQDICFAQETGYAEYIKARTGAVFAPGEIVTEDGAVIGKHKGLPYYTVGQRRGLGVSSAEPLYVVRLDAGTNRVVVGRRSAVMKKSLIAHRLTGAVIGRVARPLRITARIRYNHPKDPARITGIGRDAVRVDFDRPQSAPTPGQAVVFYDRRIVLGGGLIGESLP